MLPDHVWEGRRAAFFFFLPIHREGEEAIGQPAGGAGDPVCRSPGTHTD